MKAILYCPDDMTTVPEFRKRGPLALMPFLGKTVLEHGLDALTVAGVRSLRVIAPNAAGQLRHHVGRGERWGMALETTGRADEWTRKDCAAPTNIRLLKLDRLPQLPGHELWRDYLAWHTAQMALLPEFASRRVGMKEIAPQVFVGLRTRIAPDVRLSGPCWVGDNVRIGAHAIIGPGSIIEDDCYVDEGAEIQDSVIGKRTYVGALTEIRNSFADGDKLLHLDTGSQTNVSDRFLLCALKPQRQRWLGWAARVSDEGIGRVRQSLRSLNPWKKLRVLLAASH